MEAAFREVPGVVSTAVGYCGGNTESPTYEQVCSGRTGHAEAVQIELDPARVSYKALVDLFFRLHDPVLRGRQGSEAGSQYRSAIFFHTPEQQQIAGAAKARLETGGASRRRISTEIVPAPVFWRAEEYHQRYYDKLGASSCRF